MQFNGSRLLRPYHVALRLQKSVRTVRWYAKTRRLEAKRFGKLYLFELHVVEAFRLRLERDGEALP